MPAIGAPSPAHIRKIYTIAAVLAGVAGALLAQTTETVSLETLGFQRSADVLVILILGGAGRLYGGIIGAIIYMVARDQFSGINPQYWYFWIGALLVAVVIFLPNGILGGLARLMPSRGGEPVSAPALSTRGLDKSFGSLVVANKIEINLPQGERYALIGPNGAGKTTLINLMTGMLQPDGGQILLGSDDITAAQARGTGQARPRAHVPDQHAVSAPQPAGGGDARHLRAARLRGRLVAEAAGLWRRDRGGVCNSAVAAARRKLLPADARTGLWPAAAA